MLNPLIIKGYRERLRMKHAIPWSVVVVVVAGFVYAFAYYIGVKQNGLEHRDASKAALASVLVMQAILLMLFGTGSVATGIVRERLAGVLDYQRMTPMTPASKIIGYLFGLPAREYVLAALLMPYIVFAAIASEVSFSNLLQLYIVGMSSVWLYHMIGMVAGMVAPRPWKAGVATQAMVLITYFVLPALGKWGFTFFLYLTPRPVFAKLAVEEMGLGSSAFFSQSDLPNDGSVPFFWFEFDPMLFTLLVQGFLLVSLFVIVYRKWKEETQHPFTKVYALLFYAAVQIGLLGSLWPWLTNSQRFHQVEDRLRNFGVFRLPGSSLGDVMIGMLLSVFYCMSIAGVLLLTNMITPNRHAYASGIRRAKKLGLPGNPRTNDFADAMPYMFAFVLMTWVSYTIFIALAINSEHFFTRTPSLFALAMPALIFAALAIYLQGLRSRWGTRGLSMGLFIFWLVPFLLFATMLAAGASHVAVLYVAAPMPGSSLLYCIVNLFDGLMTSRVPLEQALLDHAERLTLFSLGINLLLALLFARVARQQLTRIREYELNRVEPGETSEGNRPAAPRNVVISREEPTAEAALEPLI